METLINSLRQARPLLEWTRFGRHLYATGSNERAAQLSGVHTRRLVLLGFVLASLMAVLSGLLLTARLDTGESNVGASLPLESIAACVIAGVSLQGGQGRTLAVLIGTLLIMLVQNGLNLMQVGVGKPAQLLLAHARVRGGFVVAGLVAGAAGALFAYSKGSISPETLAVGKSVDCLVMVLLGGIQTLAGPVVGAFTFSWLHDTVARNTEYWRALLGLIILTLVLLFPQGIAGSVKQMADRLRRRTDDDIADVAANHPRQAAFATGDIAR